MMPQPTNTISQTSPNRASVATGKGGGVESPIGWMPRYADIDWSGLDFSQEKFEDELMSVNREEWEQELASHDQLFAKLGEKLPGEFMQMRGDWTHAIEKAPAHWTMSD